MDQYQQYSEKAITKGHPLWIEGVLIDEILYSIIHNVRLTVMSFALSGSAEIFLNPLKLPAVRINQSKAQENPGFQSEFPLSIK